MHLKWAACAAIGLATLGCSGGSYQAISGAMLIDGTSRPPVESAVILVKDGKIEALGSRDEVKIPKNTVIFQESGRFIFPLDPAFPLKKGGSADLLILTVNPALDPDYARRSVGRMQGGRWMQYPQ